jgi:hypothetical protein
MCIGALCETRDSKKLLLSWSCWGGIAHTLAGLALAAENRHNTGYTDENVNN